MVSAGELVLVEADGGITFSVRVVPRASRTGIAGLIDGALKVRIAAPPVDGAANEELIRGLAKLLELPMREVEIVRGHTGRSKLVRVPSHCAARLAELAQSRPGT
jgi:uncharacterized protein (TIGR00251 family)